MPTVSKMRRIRRQILWFHLAVSGAVVVMSLALFIYPAVTICRLAADSQLDRTGESRLVPGWFEAAAGRYVAWADDYIRTNFARSLYHDDIPATEWPIFASAFVLVTAEDLHAQGKIDARRGTVREAVEKAAQIVASPVTATWVKTKWGSGYLERENVFYRMLVVLGLASYERITGNAAIPRDDGPAADDPGRRTGRRPVSPARRLSQRMLSGRYALGRGGDPAGGPSRWRRGRLTGNSSLFAGQISPGQERERSAGGRLGQSRQHALANALIADFDGPLKRPKACPPSRPIPARGGSFRVPRLRQFGHPIVYGRAGPGRRRPLVRGLRKELLERHRLDRRLHRKAARRARPVHGRGFRPGVLRDRLGLDRLRHRRGKGGGPDRPRAPLTLETVACSWPTPFGFLVPGIMGGLAAHSWSLGEVALLFSMTRPTHAARTVPFTGHAPAIVWILVVVYLGTGLFSIWFEIRSIRRRLRQYRDCPPDPAPAPPDTTAALSKHGNQHRTERP